MCVFVRKITSPKTLVLLSSLNTTSTQSLTSFFFYLQISARTHSSSTAHLPAAKPHCWLRSRIPFANRRQTGYASVVCMFVCENIVCLLLYFLNFTFETSSPPRSWCSGFSMASTMCSAVFLTASASSSRLHCLSS